MHLSLVFPLAVFIHFKCSGVLTWKHLALNQAPEELLHLGFWENVHLRWQENGADSLNYEV